MAPPLDTTNKQFGLLRWVPWIGPGFVYALTVLGPADLVSNAAAGSGYGYALIWTLAFTVIFRFVWVGVSAKYVLVTGECLSDGYARAGRWAVWMVLISTVLLGHFYMMYTLVMCGNAVNILLPLPSRWSSTLWSLFFIILAFLMTYRGGYRTVETFCKVLIAFMTGSLLVAVYLARPDPVEVLRGTLVPSLPGSAGLYATLFVVMALLGTMGGSITNLTYAYFIYERGWRDTSYLKQQRLDLIFGTACLFLIGGLVQMAAGATLHPLGIDLEDADDLVRIFSEVQGVAGMVIFSLGLWGATFSSLVGMLIGYSLIVTDLIRVLLGRPAEGSDARQRGLLRLVHRICLIFYAVSPLYGLFLTVNPIWLILLVNALVVVTIPALTPVLLKITSDQEIMGRYRNSPVTNAVLVVMVATAIYFGSASLLETLRTW